MSSVTSVSNNSILQQMHTLEASLHNSSATQQSGVAEFMRALEQVLHAGSQILSANSAQASLASSGSTSSQVSATDGTSAATATDMLASAQSAEQPPYTPVTAWGAAAWSTSPYNSSNGAAAGGASQMVDGVQIIPGATGWNPNASQLSSIYSGMEGTWTSLGNNVTPQAQAVGPNGWANSAYNPANNAAARGASHIVDGVQLVPGAPGWNPGAPQLRSVYAGMQSTWDMLNAITP